MKKLVALLGCLGLLLLLCALPTQLIITGIAASAPQLQAQATACAAHKATCADTAPAAPGNFTVPAGSSKADAIVLAARALASHLYSVPNVFYKDLPANLIAYYNGNCPPGSYCWATWQSGNFQCVQFVAGAYFLAGYPLPALGNAIDFWSLYAARSGYQRIATSQGFPAPGDIMVWDHGLFGHVAVVVEVIPPRGAAPGKVVFAQANAGLSIDSHLLYRNGRVQAWPGYTVLGYIRPL